MVVLIDSATLEELLNRSEALGPKRRKPCRGMTHSVEILQPASTIGVQWVPRFKSAQDKSIRDLRARSKSASHVYTKRYQACIFPPQDKSNVQ